MAITIRPMQKEDWPEVQAIYQQGINEDEACFFICYPDYETFDNSRLVNCRFVACINELVVGWATLSKVYGGCSYSGVAEVSLYLKQNYRDKGLGGQLMDYIIESSEQAGYWTIQAEIMQENKASIRMCQKCGFREIGYREKIGKDSLGNWQNTVWLERRSKLAKYN